MEPLLWSTFYRVVEIFFFSNSSPRIFPVSFFRKLVFLPENCFEFHPNENFRNESHRTEKTWRPISATRLDVHRPDSRSTLIGRERRPITSTVAFYEFSNRTTRDNLISLSIEFRRPTYSMKTICSLFEPFRRENNPHLCRCTVDSSWKSALDFGRRKSEWSNRWWNRENFVVMFDLPPIDVTKQHRSALIGRAVGLSRSELNKTNRFDPKKIDRERQWTWISTTANLCLLGKFRPEFRWNESNIKSMLIWQFSQDRRRPIRTRRKISSNEIVWLSTNSLWLVQFRRTILKTNFHQQRQKIRRAMRENWTTNIFLRGSTK